VWIKAIFPIAVLAAEQDRCWSRDGLLLSCVRCLSCRSSQTARPTFFAACSRPDPDSPVLSRQHGPGELTVLHMVGANDLADYQQRAGA
jgi:hypothetical protein